MRLFLFPKSHSWQKDAFSNYALMIFAKSQAKAKPKALEKRNKELPTSDSILERGFPLIHVSEINTSI